MRRLLPLLLLLIFMLPTFAQDEEPDSIGVSLVYGEVVSGQINNTDPSRVYAFDALRCDFISIRVSTINGDLDPLVTIIDDTGTAIFSRDDGNGEVGVNYEPVAIPRSGRYSVVVSRFGYGLGTTSGGFELLIERIGNGSAFGCALRYGDSIVNSISNMEPSLIYQFRASEGDIVNVKMESISGELDPYLTIADRDGYVLESNDDVLGSGINAEIQALLIPADGTYYIIATRYGEETGDSTGNFILTLQEAQNSGLGNSPLAPFPLRMGGTIEGTIDEDRSAQYYRFEANQNDIVSVSMNRAGGNLDAYVVIANADLQELAFNDDSNESQNALIENYLIPADGTYFIIATRFERENGATQGRFNLSLRSDGNAFEGVPTDVPRITYGISLTGNIDDVNPDALYVFWGEEGDVITLSLSRGDGTLDPVLSILAADRQTVLVSDDDSGGGQNARIERFEVTSTGVYYIRVSRYTGTDNPGTVGSYVLVVARRFD